MEEKNGKRKDGPRVTTALKSPLATRSISSSICCSVDEGELRMPYVDVEASELDCPAGEVGGTDVGGGGRRENRDGDGAMKERYWSTT